MEATIALFSAAISTLESLAFTFAEPVRDEDVQGAPAWAGSARVSFTGPWDGELRVRLDAGALCAVSANMLGSDRAPGGDLQRDALGELANVICGNVLSQLAGSTPIFILAAPRPGDGGEAPEAGDVRVLLRLEGGYADVVLHVTGVPAHASP